MTRDRLTRMDIDTGWAYHRKQRSLQRLHPERWPIYWSAYMALLGEAWATGNRRLTLEEAWCPAIPCTPAEAFEALRAAHILDPGGRIPIASWRQWYEPAAKRIKTASEKGLKGARARWHSEDSDADSDSNANRTDLEQQPDSPKTGHLNGAQPMPGHSPRNAPRQPASQPTTPASGRAPARVRDDGSRDPERERSEAIARAKAKLDDPDASEDIKFAARFSLKQLGAA